MKSARQDCLRRATACVAGRLAALLLVVGLAGCGPSNRRMPAPSDPAQGRQALKTTLDAWKSGAAPEALLASQPPIRVSDEDWKAGRRLIGYQVVDEGEIYGLTLRCGAVLALESLPGQVEQKSVRYAVATNPSICVTREDRDY